MVLKLYQINDFSKLYEKIKDSSFSLKTAYKFYKLQHNFENELNFYFSHFRSIIEKYCLRDENNQPVVTKEGKEIQLIPEKIEECQKELDELNLMEFEIEIEKFSLDELEGLKLSPLEFNSLNPFIEE